MAIQPFLAMTAAEFQANRAFYSRIGWLACHVCPYSRGLSNLPGTLPRDSLLVVDDATPIQGHDPEVIAAQLEERVQALSCAGILLDFQRPENAQTAQLANHLTSALSCPVAVSAIYAKGLACPVFLPPVSLSTPLEDHIRSWHGRELWLELAMDAEIITLTGRGAQTTYLTHFCAPEGGFVEEKLHCHYRIETPRDTAVFTLWRTREDLQALLEEAAGLGIANAVGLYQELHP